MNTEPVIGGAYVGRYCTVGTKRYISAVRCVGESISLHHNIPQGKGRERGRGEAAEWKRDPVSPLLRGWREAGNQAGREGGRGTSPGSDFMCEQIPPPLPVNHRQ